MDMGEGGSRRMNIHFLTAFSYIFGHIEDIFCKNIKEVSSHFDLIFGYIFDAQEFFQLE